MVLASSIPVASDAVNKRSYLHNSSSNKQNIYIYIEAPRIPMDMSGTDGTVVRKQDL